MKKTIFAIALLVLSSGRAQIVQQVIATSPVQAAGCSPTLLTGAANDWQFWNPEVACISTCANGGHITDVPDSIASLNALQSTSSLTPTYTTGGINGLVVGLYNHGAQTRLVTSSPISTGNTTTTWFAVLNPTDFSANGFIIVGNFGSTGNLE